MAKPEQDVSSIVMLYREAARGTGDPNPEKANEWARKLHEHYKMLRQSEAGRAGIGELMSDADAHVRCWAASHFLVWNPERARPVLEQLREARGVCSFDAGVVLNEFDAGTLSFDY